MSRNENIGKGFQTHESIVLNHRIREILEEQIPLLLVHIQPQIPDLPGFQAGDHRGAVDEGPP